MSDVREIFYGALLTLEIGPPRSKYIPFVLVDFVSVAPFGELSLNFVRITASRKLGDLFDVWYADSSN